MRGTDMPPSKIPSPRNHPALSNCDVDASARSVLPPQGASRVPSPHRQGRREARRRVPRPDERTARSLPNSSDLTHRLHDSRPRPRRHRAPPRWPQDVPVRAPRREQVPLRQELQQRRMGEDLGPAFEGGQRQRAHVPLPPRIRPVLWRGGLHEVYVIAPSNLAPSRQFP